MQPTKWTSTGIATLDVLFGEGLPHGVISELGGDLVSGQVLSLQLAASAQRRGQIVAYIDGRQTFKPETAARAGVKISELLVSQPSSLEEAMQIVETLVRSAVVDLIIVDYDLRQPTEPELSGFRARFAGQVLRRLTSAAFRSPAAVVFVTGETRPTSERSDTSWENALKFYACLRCLINRVPGGAVIRTSKNKFTPPFRSADLAFEVQS